jgi:hypothetical protein
MSKSKQLNPSLDYLWEPLEDWEVLQFCEDVQDKKFNPVPPTHPTRRVRDVQSTQVQADSPLPRFAPRSSEFITFLEDRAARRRASMVIVLLIQSLTHHARRICPAAYEDTARWSYPSLITKTVLVPHAVLHTWVIDVIREGLPLDQVLNTLLAVKDGLSKGGPAEHVIERCGISSQRFIRLHTGGDPLAVDETPLHSQSDAQNVRLKMLLAALSPHNIVRKKEGRPHPGQSHPDLAILRTLA